MRRAALSLLLGGVLTAQALAQSGPWSSAEALAIGLRQLDEGDVEAAVITFDSLVRQLTAGKESGQPLATAHAHLALAYLQLTQLDKAVVEIRQACRAYPELRLDPERFPPTLIRLFEDARAELAAQARPASRPAPGPSPPAGSDAQAQPERKPGGSKLVPVLLGVGGAAAVALALGGGGDGAPSSDTPSTPVEERVAALATLTQPSDDGYVCPGAPCDPTETDYAVARAVFNFSPLPLGQRVQGTLGMNVYLEMNSPNRFRVSPRDGCAPNAQLLVQLFEPSGARHEFAEQPFVSRTDPVYTAETTLQLSYPLSLTGPFTAGNWDLTLTWRHYANGPTRCEGLVRLNTASLEVLVRR